MKALELFGTTAMAVLIGAGPTLAQLSEVGASEGQVNIVAWAGYIERGETDKAFDWVTKFEAESGCKVNVKTAGTSDEMVALMNEGGFDLVTASGDASLRLIAGKRRVDPSHLVGNLERFAIHRLRAACWLRGRREGLRIAGRCGRTWRNPRHPFCPCILGPGRSAGRSAGHELTRRGHGRAENLSHPVRIKVRRLSSIAPPFVASDNAVAEAGRGPAKHRHHFCS